jgi:hypothetical protein
MKIYKAMAITVLAYVSEIWEEEKNKNKQTNSMV